VPVAPNEGVSSGANFVERCGAVPSGLHCDGAVGGPHHHPERVGLSSLKDGSGTSPTATDTVSVHYRGTLADGREFDSSHKRGQPAEFPLNRVIPCWTEGVQMMKPGGKARLTCPPAIAYGERGAGAVIPPNATLQFEVELLSVRR